MLCISDTCISTLIQRHRTFEILILHHSHISAGTQKHPRQTMRAIYFSIYAWIFRVGCVDLLSWLLLHSKWYRNVNERQTQNSCCCVFFLLVIRSINFPVTESNNGGFYSLLFLSVTLSCWFFIFHFNRLTGQNETSTMNFKWMRLQLDNQLN